MEAGAPPSADPEIPERNLEVRPSVPFLGELDVEALVRAMPSHHRIRGMFCARVLADLGDAVAEIAPVLSARVDRYQPFTHYPTSDYLRLFDLGARRTYPTLDRREAWRRYARSEIEGFSATMLGRVTLSLLSDPTAALLRYPEVFGVLAVGPTATATRVDERCVVVEMHDQVGPPEHTIGVLEGLVMSFRRHPRIRYERSSGPRRFEVRWTL